MLNKNSLLAAVVTVVVVCSAVFFMKAGSKQDTLFAENVEALSQNEAVIGIGRICAYDELTWCIYLFPYECYDGVFVSDPIVP